MSEILVFEFGCLQVEIEPLTTDKEEAGMAAAETR
jgi:hypothetical protein